jgi:hypothetical protein
MHDLYTPAMALAISVQCAIQRNTREVALRAGVCTIICTPYARSYAQLLIVSPMAVTNNCLDVVNKNGR